MEKNKSKKTYMFYVSDYHFEMVSLLKIKKELQEGKKVVILTQNNLEESIKKVLSRLTMKNEEKNKIKNLNWTEELNSKYKQMVKLVSENERISIFIKGDEKYIKEQNKKVKKLVKNKENISIVDCYNFNEIKEGFSEISNNYEERLVTKNNCSN